LSLILNANFISVTPINALNFTIFHIGDKEKDLLNGNPAIRIKTNTGAKIPMRFVCNIPTLRCIGWSISYTDIL
jgi:hypothetical protein